MQQLKLRANTLLGVILIYNLDVIISVGYRVNSKAGVAFHRWATARLYYLPKSVVMDCLHFG
ncbi:RhuM family protein [Moraxella cuniculi]|uniref:RhuM family protein n=1 Tax=Moraxella cuniculi TaxID=34061 RepID=UPI00099402E4|nr:RhuM family protein [Moraxella cuniculi]